MAPFGTTRMGGVNTLQYSHCAAFVHAST